MTEIELNININNWFQKNYDYLRGEVSTNIANNQMSDYSDDLLNLCVESFLKRSYESKLQMLQDNKISNYILKCCSFQIKSGSSPFYNQYRKYYTSHNFLSDFQDGYVSEEESITSNMYLCYRREMENLNWYEQKLLNLKFFENLSYKNINQIYHLPISTLKKEIQIVLNKIKTKCINC